MDELDYWSGNGEKHFECKGCEPYGEGRKKKKIKEIQAIGTGIKKKSKKSSKKSKKKSNKSKKSKWIKHCLKYRTKSGKIDMKAAARTYNKRK
jgi:hypothetical protein